MTSRLVVAWRGLALGILAAVGYAGTPLSGQQHPIIWTLTTATRSPQQGKQFMVTIAAQIPFGWHLYSMTQPPGGPTRTVISVVGDSNFVLAGGVRVREPDSAPDPNFDIPNVGPLITETYLDSVTFVIPVLSRVAGRQTLHINVHYQTCTNRYCLAPMDTIMELPLQLASGAVPAVIERVEPLPPPAETANPPPAAAVPAPVTSSVPAGTTSQSLLLFLGLAATMGALSLLTPCVFPMIPITVSYFTRTNETARGSPARNALVYATGIVATFTVLGMAIAVLVGAGGINRFAANPWINLLVTGVFVAFALNLFGVYQIGLPASLLTRLDGATRRGGSETAGILLMGLTFTLTSFTCTTPFVGTLLVMAARGSWIWPLSGLLVFSAVFALPFFLLALMPSAVAKLPRSGSWLQSVKVVMGFVELATAMKFLSNADLVLQWGIFTRTVVLAVWLAIALTTVMYLLGILGRSAGESRARPGPIRIGVVLATLAITVYLGFGLTGRRVGELESFLPPPEGGISAGETAVRGELSWMVNAYDAGLARARAERKDVLVDFTGYTCTNCRWMEANMFPRTVVVHELERFVRVRLYTDGQGDVYRRQQKLEQDKLGTVALPYYAIVDSLGGIKAQFLGMTRSADQFVQFLSHGVSVVDP